MNDTDRLPHAANPLTGALVDAIRTARDHDARAFEYYAAYLAVRDLLTLALDHANALHRRVRQQDATITSMREQIADMRSAPMSRTRRSAA